MTWKLDEMFGLRGRRVLVTGAAGGIGGAAARACRDLGASVMAADIDEGAVEGCDWHRVDLADEASIARLAATAGEVDVLLNIAGVAEYELSEEVPLAVWRRTLDINLTGTFLLSQAVGRGMIARQRGKIVNAASRCGFIGMPFSAAYNASKAGVTSLTQTLAIEWSVHNIQVNAVVPGFVRSRMTAREFADPAVAGIFGKKIPLGRVSEPDDLVGALVFLSSAASDYITGATLFVDGGNYASGGVGVEARDSELERRGRARP